MAKSNVLSELWVRLPASKYPIIIGEHIFDDKNILRGCIKTQDILIVTNKTIAPLYLEYILQHLSGYHCKTVILEDGESFKNYESLFQIYSTLIENHYHRDTTLIALGGGVVGDITGFAASTYQRGVDFVQIPTTLLAQVDAAVGGKTAFNFMFAKNIIGSFYQPSAIYIDTHFLRTLPLREFRAGIAEIIKYAILRGGSFLQCVQTALEEGLAVNAADNLAEIIYKCCQIKAFYVEQDERESSMRALLNLGHTVAHALESYSHYTRWLHGEAVGIGLYVAALFSHRYYGLEKKSLLLIDNLLKLSGLPHRIPADIDLVKLRIAMDNDKKIKNNQLSFILIKRLGECCKVDKINDSELQHVLELAVEETNNAS